MKKYEIDLQSEAEDKFDSAEDNMIQVIVYDSSGKTLDPSTHRVQIVLSRSSMIGLGTELIRQAHAGPEKSLHSHIDPIDQSDLDNICQQMGVYASPESCEIILSEDDLGTIGAPKRLKLNKD